MRVFTAGPIWGVDGAAVAFLLAILAHSTNELSPWQVFFSAIPKKTTLRLNLATAWCFWHITACGGNNLAIPAWTPLRNDLAQYI
jgi:hypothetical protein